MYCFIQRKKKSFSFETVINKCRKIGLHLDMCSSSWGVVKRQLIKNGGFYSPFKNSETVIPSETITYFWNGHIALYIIHRNGHVVLKQSCRSPFSARNVQLVLKQSCRSSFSARNVQSVLKHSLEAEYTSSCIHM